MTLEAFDELRNQIFAQHGGSPYGGQTTPGSPGVKERALDSYRRGQADLTLDNVLKAVGFGVGIASGTGPITLGANLLGHQVAPGLVGNPMPKFGGFIGPTPQGRAIIQAGGTLADAFRSDRLTDRVSRGSYFTSRGYGGPPTRGGGGNRGGTYAEGGAAATAAHDRSRQGAGV